MARLACLLLALLPLSRGGAVLDLINLFHQYEDEIIGRGQGVNPEPVQDYDQEVEAGEKDIWRLSVKQKTTFLNFSFDFRKTHRGSWLGRRT